MGLSEELKTTEVSSYGVALYRLPDGYLDDDLEQKLSKYLDRGGVAQFFRDQLNRRLAEVDLMPKGKVTIRLIDIQGFSDTLDLAKSLVALLNTLPWQYTLYVRGPAGFFAGTAQCPLEVAINDRFGLVSPHKLAKAKFTTGIPSLDEWLWRGSLTVRERGKSLNWIYFYFKATGYIPDVSYNFTVDEFEAEIRSFFGCCIATNKVFPFEDYQSNYQTFVVFHTCGSDNIIRPAGSLSTDVYQALHFAVTEELLTRFRSSARLTEKLNDIIGAMSLKGDAKLRTAATWIFRSGSRGTPLDRVLETTIALEVLLGDRSMSDKVGLTRLMSNRCAYALGTSDTDRREIMKNFEDFYGLRSQIVHTGKLHVDDSHETLIDWAVETASSVFKYELGLVPRNGT